MKLLLSIAGCFLVFINTGDAKCSAKNENASSGTTACLVNRRGAIRGMSNRCIDASDAHSWNFTPLQLYDCYGTPQQTFMVVGSDSTIRVFGKCIGLKDGSTNSGTVVDLYDCTGATTQQWLITSSGQIISMRADKCLHSVTSENRSAIQIKTCDNSENQRWIFINL